MIRLRKDVKATPALRNMLDRMGLRSRYVVGVGVVLEVIAGSSYDKMARSSRRHVSSAEWHSRQCSVSGGMPWLYHCGGAS